MKIFFYRPFLRRFWKGISIWFKVINYNNNNKYLHSVSWIFCESTNYDFRIYICVIFGCWKVYRYWLNFFISKLFELHLYREFFFLKKKRKRKVKKRERLIDYVLLFFTWRGKSSRVLIGFIYNFSNTVLKFLLLRDANLELKNCWQTKKFKQAQLLSRVLFINSKNQVFKEKVFHHKSFFENNFNWKNWLFFFYFSSFKKRRKNEK